MKLTFGAIPFKYFPKIKGHSGEAPSENNNIWMVGFVFRCIIFSRYYLFQVISILGNIWILDGWICYPLYNLFQVLPPGLLISVKVLLWQEKGYWRGLIHKKSIFLHTTPQRHSQDFIFLHPHNSDTKALLFNWTGF